MRKSSLVFILIQGILGQDLVTISHNHDQSQETACCVGQNIKSCQVAAIHGTLLGKGKISLPGGIKVSFLNNIDNNPNAYNYGDAKGTEVLIHYNPKTGGMQGTAMTHEGKSFVIENCGKQGHVFKEIDISSMVDDEGYDADELRGNFSTAADDADATEDTTTVVTYSVQFYYTKDFAAATADIGGWTDLVIDETNQGYINSKVPLRIKKHCAEQVSIADGLSSGASLDSLQRLKSSLAQVRSSADVAVLLVNRFSSANACGRARLFAIDSNSSKFGQTISVVKKSCALGYYSFGHEIGHNIGLYHDIRHVNPTYRYGQGSYIEKGRASTGYRTVLAYSKSGFSRRVNYYSSPNVIYPPTGTRTGVAGSADNARLLTEQRFKLARMGDESISCNSQECVDKSTSCTYWASKNYCKVRYVAYMRKNCQKACNLCGGTTTTTTTTTTRPTTCADKNRGCPTWAARNFCRDQRYQNYMTSNCKKSCGLCTSQCSDKNSRCPGWAAVYCKNARYQVWMSVNCAKSCGKC